MLQLCCCSGNSLLAGSLLSFTSAAGIVLHNHEAIRLSKDLAEIKGGEIGLNLACPNSPARAKHERTVLVREFILILNKR